MRVLLVSFLALALASPAMAQLECVGKESGGGGASCGTRYAYSVVPAGVTQVHVGTDDCDDANYTNWCEPAGWTHILLPVSLKGSSAKTPHGDTNLGGLSTPTACIVEWKGPATVTFDADFGFDNDQTSRDVGWLTFIPTVSLVTENFGAPVGEGVGPVHGPRKPLGFGAIIIPTVSEWGLIVLTP